MRYPLLLVFTLLFMSTGVARAADLVIAERGKSAATVVVSASAGTCEKKAAEDLVHSSA